MEIHSSPYGVRAPDSEIHSVGEPMMREDEKKADDVGYDDMGGCRRQAARWLN